MPQSNSSQQQRSDQNRIALLLGSDGAMSHFVLHLLKFRLVTAIEHKKVLPESILYQPLARGGFPVTLLRVALAPVAVRRVDLRRGTGGFEAGDGGSGLCDVASIWSSERSVSLKKTVVVTLRGETDASPARLQSRFLSDSSFDFLRFTNLSKAACVCVNASIRRHLYHCRGLCCRTAWCVRPSVAIDAAESASS